MSYWLRNRMIALSLLVVVVHTLLLFLVIPALSSRLAPSFNQERYADGYDQLAESLVAGNGYRFYPDTASTLMREPGYPLFLAGLFSVAGESFVAVKLANMILALATASLIVVLVKRSARDGRTSQPFELAVPPTLFLFHPGILLAESRGGLEILLAFLITLFMVVVCKAIEANRWRDYVLCGIVLGVTVSVRSTLMLYPVFLLFYLLLSKSREASAFNSVRNVAVMVFAMFATLSPWIIRNFALTGKFIPTASVLGVSAQAGQYIDEHLFEGRPLWLLDREAARERDRLAIAAGFRFEDGPLGYYQTFYRTEDELGFSKYLFSLVLDKYERSPLLFARSVGLNIFNFWFSGKTWAATAINAIVQLPYLLLAFAGIVRKEDRRSKAFWPMSLLIVYVMLVHLPIIAQARYSIPLMPLISILAAGGLTAILGYFGRSISTPPARLAGANAQ